MKPVRQAPALLAIISTLIFPFAINAQQAPSPAKDGAGVTIVSPVDRPIEGFLPDTLGGQRAAGGISQIPPDNSGGLDASTIYQEYLVTAAVSREYVGARVDVFRTRNHFAAFGLFTFMTGANKSRQAQEDFGSDGARVDGSIVFWKRNYVVRIVDTGHGGPPGRAGNTLARSLEDSIGPKDQAVNRPPLLDSLPATAMTPGSRRYFRGGASLNAFVEHGQAMFSFDGETEAVMAEYAEGTSLDRTLGKDGARFSTLDSQLGIVIVEYHTPQLATDANARATGYVSSLPENEQQQIIVKRTGNYIIAAVNVGDREFAEGLVNSIEYPYTVKWLRNPLWPTNDPFRAQKAAEMLLSTFGILGLILITVLAGGTLFGTTIFLKRRKRQQEIFSDAGDMLRLDIDPFESVILGLPPKRKE